MDETAVDRDVIRCDGATYVPRFCPIHGVCDSFVYAQRASSDRHSDGELVSLIREIDAKYRAGGCPRAFLNMVMNAVTDS
jgi:hypothetical protein